MGQCAVTTACNSTGVTLIQPSSFGYDALTNTGSQDRNRNGYIVRFFAKQRSHGGEIGESEQWEKTEFRKFQVFRSAWGRFSGEEVMYGGSQ